MKERPIIYSTDMVRAYLDDRKTMTRRVLKPQPDLGLDPFDSYSCIITGLYHPTMIDKDGNECPDDEVFGAYTEDGEWGWKCPYGQPKDELWIRETFGEPFGKGFGVIYRADYSGCNLHTWKPAIHMFRKDSRLTQTITSIKVERLLDITEEDAIAEGFTSRDEFLKYYDKLKKKRGYGIDINPWNWVLSFPKYSEEPTRK